MGKTGAQNCHLLERIKTNPDASLAQRKVPCFQIINACDKTFFSSSFPRFFNTNLFFASSFVRNGATEAFTIIF